MASSAFTRGSHTMNSMVFNLKPLARKAGYHKSTIRETMKMEKEEVNNVRHNKGEQSKKDGNLWVPDVRTGIYYPKGHEKVMEDIPPKDWKDMNWMSYGDNIH
ncbi:uncharacterized protein LOC133821630 [Humulus lupulus]|uniref:uncharacterized protein LOC133821630 n=1 Tax=Humulus lupulus TaxID=3486 RepID=UPI002B40FA43|nr:uncharacterized protein LOC133821630 [Humulus lupulus]